MYDGKKYSIDRLSYRTIREWAEHRGYSQDPDTLEEVFIFVRVLDSVWVDVETKRLNTRSKQHGKS